MADINFNTTQIQESARTAQLTRTAEPRTAQTAEVESDSRKVENEVLQDLKDTRENVVAVSDHGDTVAVSDEGEELNDLAQTTSVSAMSDEEDKESAAEILMEQSEAMSEETQKILQSQQEEIRQIEDEENFETAAAASYNAYSDQQLEQMYLKGEISRIDYQREMESRDAAEEANGEENEEFSEEMSGLSAIENQTANSMNAIQTAYASDSTTMSAQERLGAMENLDENMNADENALERRAEQDFQVSIS